MGISRLDLAYFSAGYFFADKKMASRRKPFILLLLRFLLLLFVVGRAGIEPATNGLKVRCSTS
jgi:hypothetical protein